MSPSLRFRQVHLDFHTPEQVPGIGSEFDPERFVATLRDANVNSVTCFSRCHHGWIYHDTRLPYRHPNLQCNLLAEQIRACHAADIRVPIYITVGWDHLMARLHPEWVEIDENGKQVGRTPTGNPGGWLNLDFASPYLEFVAEQTQEVCDIFGDEVDGFFFDIIFQRGVHSVWALKEFEKLGWNPEDPTDQQRMRDRLVVHCTDFLADAVRQKLPKARTFFNGGHVGTLFRKMLRNNSHVEVESLPTGGWGYMHFPITGRYARTLGLPFLGMTGRFSETWGHFNSYKNVAALEYECFQMLAQGAACSVGDQLQPGGTLDPVSYDLIGAVYAQVADKEPWCEGARPITEIAVFNAEEFESTDERMDPRNLGAARVLIEGRHQFDFVDSTSDLSPYSVVVLPDCIRVEGELKTKIEAFLASGGAVLASYTSGLDLAGHPAISGGDAPVLPEFVWAEAELGVDPKIKGVMYERGLAWSLAPGAQKLAGIDEPYFERSTHQFFGHAHSAVKGPTDRVAVAQRGRLIAFSHPIFTTYARHSMSFHRDLVLAALRRLLPKPLVRATGPTSLQATLLQQADRQVLHLLHYVPERRGLRFDIVEDRMPVHGVSVGVRTPMQRATLVPQGVALEARPEDGELRFTVPLVDGHQMVALEA